MFISMVTSLSLDPVPIDPCYGHRIELCWSFDGRNGNGELN